jgi:hypothetical protein
MKLTFPSQEFDRVVAAVCSGEPLDAEIRALNELLRTTAPARDEYIRRVEIHSRLASEPEIFVSTARHAPPAISCETGAAALDKIIDFPVRQRARNRKIAGAVALAACLAVALVGMWEFQTTRRPADSKAADDKAIAILNWSVDARWNQPGAIPQAGTLLQPGRLDLKAGLAQIVFYSGARVMIEGPAQVELTSPNEISCRAGRLMAQVPLPARAFRIYTPHIEATGVGTSIGLDVRGSSSELQVFKGSAEVSPTSRGAKQNLPEGTGAVAERSHSLKLVPGNSAAFASLLGLQTKSLAAEVQHYDRWHAATGRLNQDLSLLVHFDFEGVTDYPSMRLRSTGRGADPSETIVGCQSVSGRWGDKQGVEFQSVSDHIEMTVPGEFKALTLCAWVRVQGLDRQFNSLFMCDGFEPGEIHWMIVKDGSLALTVKGSNRGNFQAVRSPPVLSPDRFGTWVQVAVVLDGNAKRVTHYFNGRAVSDQPLTLAPPFRIDTAELGNWNADEIAIDDDEMRIRNFNGAMDEFCMFSRALTDSEIQELYLEGKPEAGY